MKKNIVFLFLFFLIHLAPSQAQDDVALFDYWKFYSDAQNSMYKTSCSLAFNQLEERKEAIAKLKTKKDYVERQQEVKMKLFRGERDSTN